MTNYNETNLAIRQALYRMTPKQRATVLRIFGIPYYRHPATGDLVWCAEYAQQIMTLGVDNEFLAAAAAESNEQRSQ